MRQSVLAGDEQHGKLVQTTVKPKPKLISILRTKSFLIQEDQTFYPHEDTTVKNYCLILHRLCEGLEVIDLCSLVYTLKGY